MSITVAPEVVDWHSLFMLLRDSFAYMDDRIDPPSSLLAMSIEDLQHKAVDETLIVAHDDDVLVGCLFCRNEPPWLYVGKLAVAASARRRGLAKALIDHAISLARGLSLDGLELETRIELSENHEAFARMGFAKISESAHPGYDRPTSIRMRAMLDSTKDH